MVAMMAEDWDDHLAALKGMLMVVKLVGWMVE